jgi:hypothetical protein
MWYSNHLILEYPPPTSLYQCVETRSIQVFWLLSQPFPRHRINLLVISETFLEPVVNRFRRQTLPTANRKHFFMNILCIESFCPQKMHNRTVLLGSTLKHGRHFDYWKQPAHTRLLPRLSCSWTVLLPSDTHRKPITSITAVLLPLVTYLLTLPRTTDYCTCWDPSDSPERNVRAQTTKNVCRGVVWQNVATFP